MTSYLGPISAAWPRKVVNNLLVMIASVRVAHIARVQDGTLDVVGVHSSDACERSPGLDVGKVPVRVLPRLIVLAVIVIRRQVGDIPCLAGRFLGVICCQSSCYQASDDKDLG